MGRELMPLPELLCRATGRSWDHQSPHQKENWRVAAEAVEERHAAALEQARAEERDTCAHIAKKRRRDYPPWLTSSREEAIWRDACDWLESEIVDRHAQSARRARNGDSDGTCETCERYYNDLEAARSAARREALADRELLDGLANYLAVQECEDPVECAAALADELDGEPCLCCQAAEYDRTRGHNAPSPPIEEPSEEDA